MKAFGFTVRTYLENGLLDADSFEVTTETRVTERK